MEQETKIEFNLVGFLVGFSVGLCLAQWDP